MRRPVSAIHVRDRWRSQTISIRRQSQELIRHYHSRCIPDRLRGLWPFSEYRPGKSEQIDVPHAQGDAGECECKAYCAQDTGLRGLPKVQPREAPKRIRAVIGISIRSTVWRGTSPTICARSNNTIPAPPSAPATAESPDASRARPWSHNSSILEAMSLCNSAGGRAAYPDTQHPSRNGLRSTGRESPPAVSAPGLPYPRSLRLPRASRTTRPFSSSMNRQRRRKPARPAATAPSRSPGRR